MLMFLPMIFFLDFRGTLRISKNWPKFVTHFGAPWRLAPLAIANLVNRTLRHWSYLPHDIRKLEEIWWSNINLLSLLCLYTSVIKHNGAKRNSYKKKKRSCIVFGMSPIKSKRYSNFGFVCKKMYGYVFKTPKIFRIFYLESNKDKDSVEVFSLWCFAAII